MMCQENDVRQNTDWIKCHSTLYSFGNFTIRQYDDSTNWNSTIWRFSKMTIRWNEVSGKSCGNDLNLLIVLKKDTNWNSHILFSLHKECVKRGSIVVFCISEFHKFFYEKVRWSIFGLLIKYLIHKFHFRSYKLKCRQYVHFCRKL